MEPVVWVLIAIGILIVVAVAAFVISRRRSERLRERFGPEYERVVQEADGRRRAEAEMAAREKRVERLEIRPLDADARDGFGRSWRDAQARFVDQPAESIRAADRLVTEVMRQRGYPMEDFEQRAADISVDHPSVVENYRAAHAISLASDHGQASTEDLRQAIVHYRSLFEVLLESGEPEEHRVVDLTDQDTDRARRYPA